MLQTALFGTLCVRDVFVFSFHSWSLCNWFLRSWVSRK
jgi:hypothetical protein